MELGKPVRTYKNEVNLIGHLGDTPEQRNGYAVFSLATKTFWKPKEATEWKERTEWHRVVVGAHSWQR
jgi:single-strand DNA-binding protein